MGTAREVLNSGYKSVFRAENSFAPTLVGDAFAAGERERGLPGRRDQGYTVVLEPVSPHNCIPSIVRDAVALKTIDGDQYGLIATTPRDVPVLRQRLREVLCDPGYWDPAKREAQTILANLERQGMCPECGEMHPYGGLCTSCLEQKARAEERAEEIRRGYRRRI